VRPPNAALVDQAVEAYEVPEERDRALRCLGESVSRFAVRLASLNDEGQRLFHLLEALRRTGRLNAGIRRLAVVLPALESLAAGDASADDFQEDEPS
jgi:hypothetical protein